MSYCFNSEYLPVPRKGMSPVEVAEYVRQEFPAEKDWLLWDLCRCAHINALRRLVVPAGDESGQIGEWTYTRQPSSYPSLDFWDGVETNPKRGDDWLGFLRVRGADGQTFLLLSFMNSKGIIGEWYMASTTDRKLLKRFSKDVYDHFHPPKKAVTIHVWGGPSISLPPESDERIFLPAALRQDIEQQTLSFSQHAAEYERLRLRHRRGFLFVGTPGVGKTMLLRHLVRETYRRFQINPLMLSISRNTRDDDIIELFRTAETMAPAMIMLEDLDSLTRECQVSRATLLAQLDGLDSKRGILVIGTTNHPEVVDPALVHRPSRFDRVWRFPLPDQALRREYLAWAFAGLDGDTVDRLARQTTDYSFAYLNELHTTAAILAMEQLPATITPDHVERAHQLLAAQFQAGKKNHICSDSETGLGFRAA